MSVQTAVLPPAVPDRLEQPAETNGPAARNGKRTPQLTTQLLYRWTYRLLGLQRFKGQLESVWIESYPNDQGHHWLIVLLAFQPPWRWDQERATALATELAAQFQQLGLPIVQKAHRLLLSKRAPVPAGPRSIHAGSNGSHPSGPDHATCNSSAT